MGDGTNYEVWRYGTEGKMSGAQEPFEEDLRTLAGRITTVIVTPDDVLMAMQYHIEFPEDVCDPRHFALCREKVIAENGVAAFNSILDVIKARLGTEVK
jgi:hypothetical protein